MIMNKYDKLKSIISKYETAAVAFSGGVDSTFLLKAAHDALKERAVAFIARFCFVPEKEYEEAVAFAESLGIKCMTVEPEVTNDTDIMSNPVDRCYICKKKLFGRFTELAKELGINVVIEGSNLDDTGDYRPGMKALSELGIKSPLIEAGFTKQEIRDYSKQLALPTWSKPSAACLASRIPYGEQITESKLRMVETAEDYLHSLGFTQLRVRLHGGNLARIELMPDEVDRFMSVETRSTVYDKLRLIGFTYITLDIHGFKSGSLNEVIKE
ncbi:MAG: ATP-dependent sacrificial sulfur transferase LarE [Lachnospiraceae bacterium]|nr:ATP-dependent sacrificial sulfur transferase LarE [Lachnospiraceae bacterium]